MVKRFLLLISLMLINISIFTQSSPENGAYKTENSNASAPTHIKTSLQQFSHVAYMLNDTELNKLQSLADKGNGEACWKLAKYFYCTDHIDKYIAYIKKGCELNDEDCLYEIIENYKNLIPCTRAEKEYFTNQLRSLGKKGNKKAQGYCYLLDDYEE